MSEQAWHDANGRPGPALRDCLLAATAAPSVHNTQPWRFGLHGNGTVDLLVDRSRQLEGTDPDGRELFVSLGAALFNLKLAVRAHGRVPYVRQLPDRDRPDVAARLAIGQPVAVPGEVAALAAAIPRRHTNRRPFAETPVPTRTLDELSRAARAEGASLLVADAPLRAAILSLTRTAGHRLRRRRTYRAELAAWTTPGGIGRRDGVPRQSFGPRDRDSALPMRDFASAHGDAFSVVMFERDPTLILVRTAGDGPAQWLTAGAAMQRVWLIATARGLAATPLSQVVEVPALRDLLGDVAHGEVVQTVLRIGRPTARVVATPRRDLDEVLVTDYPAAR
jgi:nitroreductase